MNLREIFKRENLDEMQKQTLLKIESRGFWGLWVLLLAALIIESLLGFAPREMAAEWFIFMLGSAYSVISDLRPVSGTATLRRTRKPMPLCPLRAVLPCLCGGLSNLQRLARALRCCRRSSWGSVPGCCALHCCSSA